ncbi:YggT family protein [Sinobaca qinghaiensis]|uniref:YggT family protein n=1 Tax=Sinobaca qinghaiensis TaxID=342944 RepID=A0A419V6H1_9BACL|nr:YggT family protein [Sinobaca qinghaiensis]RKD75441.1 YggT family protein [Sinobaca qinghaiensis]
MAQIGAILAAGMQIYSFIVLAYILMSWFPNARETSIGQFIGSIVEPFLEPFRRVIPPLGMFDISPLVALLVLNMASRGVAALFM